ncbi:photosystem II assembly protein Psb35 [Allocoleopsis sp.]|uniref:photosystem II assembly protein Psb35 n=1 Tax=Allocoleopsis sp. TaxID=3088169 RepID=UPI002FD50A47
MHLLMGVGVEAAPHFPVSFTLVYVVGFIAAVSIGSIAWYNSKRPPGWEGKDRPDIVPKVEKKDSPGL